MTEVLKEIEKLTRTNNGYIPNVGWAYEEIRKVVKRELEKLNGKADSN